MRIAVAVKADQQKLYPGPFGHAFQFAVYERADGGWRLLELRENPYRAMEGGGKGRLLAGLLADCDLWVGAQFGHHHDDHHHHDHHDHHDHHHEGPRRPTLTVDKGSSLEQVLALAGANLAG